MFVIIRIISGRMFASFFVKGIIRETPTQRKNRTDHVISHRMFSDELTSPIQTSFRAKCLRMCTHTYKETVSQELIQ
jgi:hypothetical protein